MLNRNRYNVIEMNLVPPFNIPKELRQLLSRDSYSLLIKGESGVGKTSLALAILEAVGLKQNFLYVSTNRSPLQILENRPWLAGRIHEPDRTKQDITWTTGSGSFVDGRLEEQSSLYERVTNELMDERAPLIVIDNWDALADSSDTESILANLKVLQIWRERARAKIIFTCEENGSRNFEFLLDGVVGLNQYFKAGRRVREMILSKLQGIEITRSSYFFTLSDGIFRSYEAYSVEDLVLATSHSDLQKTANVIPRFPTGYPEFDDVLSGGLPDKSVATIEIDETVDMRLALSLLGRMIMLHTGRGEPVVLQPSLEIREDYFKSYIDSVTSDSARNLVRISYPVSKESSGLTHRSNGKSEKNQEKLKEDVFSLKRKFEGKRLLAIAHFDSTLSESAYRRNLASFIELARHEIDLLVLITRRRRRITKGESNGSESSFEIVNMNGILFLAAKAPWSPYYAIERTSIRGKMKLSLGAMI